MKQNIFQHFWSMVLSIVAFLAITILAMFTTYTSVEAAPPANFQRTLVIGAGLEGPSGFEFAPDGRIFVLQRTGEVKIYKNGALLPQNFAVLPSIAEGDRGMIGIAFDPQFNSNHYVYFYYTGLDKLNRLVRFNASGDVGTDGPFILYQTTFPSEQLHVGGSIAFGPDGKLYFAVGDNGYPPNGQDLTNPHGKILRINKDGSIPVDNPFVGQAGKLPEIWAYGFRNPWRFQFDKQTGELYGGDVGDFSVEEVNHIVKGNNYGWSICEGPCNNPSITNPIYSYPHANESAAVTGGPVYRSSMFPGEYQGNLFFGDYAKGFIKRCVLTANGTCSQILDFDLGAGSVVDMKISPVDGSLYYITYIPGRMYQVTYSTGNHYPIPQSSASVTKGVEPLTVNFSSQGSTDPDNDPLTYKWNFGDGTTSTLANPVKTFNAKGTYTVELAVSDGSNTSQAIPLVIQVGNPPILTIGAPREGDTYKAGDTISYTASAIDGAGFDINDASIKTNVVFHHGTHIHPFLNNLVGRTHSFQTPTTGEESADTWFEIQITATDTNNLSTTKSVNVYPVKATFTLASNIPGLKVLLDGVPTTTNKVIEGVVGFIREISAPAIQTFNGKVYEFEKWADNSAPRHKITTNANPTTYTAIFKEVSGFQAEYFDNMNLAGQPKLNRVDPEINFIWNDDSPDPVIPANNFSARWTKTQYFAFGRYKFIAKADDGFRLFVDGNQIIDNWTTPTLDQKEATIDLTAGEHIIKMEYFENGGGAIAQLTWDLASTQPEWTEIPTDSFKGEYFDNQNLTGTPKLTRSDSQINFVWDNLSPDPIIPADHFSTRWTKTTDFEAGNYEFTVTADDGVRLYIDNELLIDKWLDQGSTTYKVSKQLTADVHTIKLEYYENGGGAVAIFNYEKKVISFPTPTPTPTPTPNSTVGYAAKYWNTPTANSAPTVPATAPDLQRTDTEINFAWNDGSPDPKINLDHFAAQWSKTEDFVDGKYTFTTTSDDGIRVYLDNAVILDQWNDHGSTVFTVEKEVTAGSHTIKVEYYENGGGAIAKFSFQKTGEITPPPANNDLELYTDALLSGWENWSWGSTINLDNNNPVQTGAKSLSFIADSAWAGLRLHNNTPADLSTFKTLNFAAKASTNNQVYQVSLYAGDNQLIGTSLLLQNYGGNPVADNFKQYSIPLTAFGGNISSVKDIVIQSLSNNPQPALYLDQIIIKK